MKKSTLQIYVELAAVLGVEWDVQNDNDVWTVQPRAGSTPQEVLAAQAALDAIDKEKPNLNAQTVLATIYMAADEATRTKLWNAILEMVIFAFIDGRPEVLVLAATKAGIELPPDVFTEEGLNVVRDQLRRAVRG